MVTFTIAIAQDMLKEPGETFTLGLATIGSRDSEITIAPASATGLTVTILDDDTARALALTGPSAIAEGASATYTITLTGDSFYAAATINWAATGGIADITSATTGSVTFATSDAAGATKTFTINTADNAATDARRAFTLTLADPGIANTVVGAALTVSITDDDDNPTARAARVKTPLAATAIGIGQLAAQTIGKRLRFDGASTFNAAPAATAGDVLRQSAFSLAHGNGGINFWGSGGYAATEGDHDGTAYDGDTTALHLGADTAWKNGLLGIAITRSNSDMDFNGSDNLETKVTSVHPYLTRKFAKTKLWTTIGHGTGDAELKEPGAAAKTDVTVTTAALGATYAPLDNVHLNLAGQWSRAELERAVLSNGNVLPAVDADALRISAAAELSGRRDAWRSFLTVNLRHDSGDGDTGTAGDLGGGVEWHSSTATLRLEGSKYLTGSGAEEERLTLAARKTAGRLNLGLAVGMEDGLTTANLLSGELRF